MYNNIFLLAFNPTNGICNESFFENTITLYPTNETGNIYFSNKIVDISSKKVLNEYKSFIYNTTKKIVDKNRNAKFILYNDKKRITDLCSNMLHLNIIQGNSTNIISNLNNKFYVREYLRNDVPMLNYIYFDKEHTISYHEICKIIKNNIFVAQTQNGAGKTTAIKLLCGLYYPTKGDILINGKSSRVFSSESYFDLFSAVFQDYGFLPMTIAENICASTDYDKERLYSAFEKSGIADKINSLNKKENTFMIKDVYKDAVDFSGGEKQKLLLAKAIYKNAPVLILDEPTAALDPIAENELYLKYNEMTNNKISFFISHRLSSTRFCDRILFIKDGKIAESGTHEELMALKGSYYRMYQLQSYYYKEMGGEAV